MSTFSRPVCVDTSVWIEFFKGNPEFVSKLSALLDEGGVVALECVFGELLQGTKTKREGAILQEYWMNLPKLEEEGIWLRAGLISSTERYFAKGVGLIDLAILAAARKNGLRVWTLDKKLRSCLTVSERFQ